MLYTLSEKILPSYYRDNYGGSYKILHIHKGESTALQPSVIEALHYHRCAEIGICVCGSGITHVDDRIYAFSQGDMQFVPPGVPHLSAATPGVETRWQWISFEPRRILEDSGYQQTDALTQRCAELFSGVFHPWEYPRLAQLIYRFRDAALTPDAYSEQEIPFLTGQLLVECARIGKDVRPETVNKGYAGKLKPAVLYIRENFADKEAMRQERIAQVCGMSVSHFRAVFKRETGMSVRDFIIQTRLAKAAYLLKNTDASVLSVAMESGFGQVSCFNRIFSKTFGRTPTSFRKHAGNG